VTEQKAGYITADTLQSKVLICILAKEVRRNRSATRAGVSAVRRAQFAPPLHVARLLFACSTGRGDRWGKSAGLAARNDMNKPL
jgi:hypothetical protein